VLPTPDTELLTSADVDPSAFREPPVHVGVLGFEDFGTVVQRFSVLFKDRLDSWDHPKNATTGQPPRGRIALCDIRSVEMIRGGFVFKCKGRKVEVFVDNPEDVIAWGKALHSVIHSPYPPGNAAGPKAFVPRVANLPQPARQHSPGLTPRVTICAGRSLHRDHRDGVRVNTHKDGLQAGLLIHGKEAVALHPGQRTVSGKVNERVRPLEGPAQPAEKVTGQRHLTPRKECDAAPPCGKITGERLLSPRRGEAPVSAKVNPRSPSEERRSCSPEHHALPQHITDIGREQDARTRSRSTSPLCGKITGAVTNHGGARVQLGSSALDKCRPLGASGSTRVPGSRWS